MVEPSSSIQHGTHNAHVQYNELDPCVAESLVAYTFVTFMHSCTDLRLLGCLYTAEPDIAWHTQKDRESYKLNIVYGGIAVTIMAACCGT